jgi:hypothetical protein
MKQAAIADRCSLKRAAEVACEFVARCSGPPHQYSIAAPTARKIFDRWCKKTFATKSAISGPTQMAKYARWHAVDRYSYGTAVRGAREPVEILVVT